MWKSNLTGVLVFSLASMAWGQSNANGIGYFALEIPSDVSITIDGNDSDWSWYDPNFIVGPDEMFDNQKGETLDKSDLDIAIMTAWTGQDRDNRLYGYVKTTDDTLIVTSTVFDDWWRDDSLEIVIDANASGGLHDGAASWGRGSEGQQFTMHLPVPGVYETPYADGSWWMGWKVTEEIHWMDELADAKTLAGPSGAGTGSTDVTLNYEFSMPAWDLADLSGPDASVRHNFKAGEIIRLTYQVNDADNEEERRTHQLATTLEGSASEGCDVCSEYTMLAIGEYDRADGGVATALEEQSWAKIKATFKR